MLFFVEIQYVVHICIFFKKLYILFQGKDKMCDGKTPRSVSQFGFLKNFQQ